MGPTTNSSQEKTPLAWTLPATSQPSPSGQANPSDGFVVVEVRATVRPPASSRATKTMRP